MISAAFDFSAVNAKLDKLTQAAIVATRPAAQAGAQVFYEEVLQRVPVGEHEHRTKGKKFTFQPGNLQRAIYQAFVEDESNANRSTYRVSWNKRKAFYGAFVEFGTSRTAAQPFLRPSYDAQRARAISTVKQEMAAQLQKVLPK